jgi:hypothetical protein
MRNRRHVRSMCAKVSPGFAIVPESRAGSEKAKGMFLRLDQLMYMRLGVSEKKSEWRKYYFIFFFEGNVIGHKLASLDYFMMIQHVSNKLIKSFTFDGYSLMLM